MKTSTSKVQGARAITSREVLVVIGSLMLVFSLIVQNTPHRRRRATRIECVSHQMQMALGLRQYADDHENKFPWQNSIRLGVSSWIALSNELRWPRILACPDDKETTSATNFADFTSSNISYFISFDAVSGQTQSVLLGDRNITGGGSRKIRVFTNAADTKAAGWDSTIHKHAGNIALADGSAQQASERYLQNQLFGTLVAYTNRITLVLPR